MPISYAEKFEPMLLQKFEAEQRSFGLYNSNPEVTFMNAKTIKVPDLTLSGYKDHTRAGQFNRGSITNTWTPLVLGHDRDVEYALDPMDVDETNLTVSIANVQNVFEREHAIPERDAYTFSKLYAELVANSVTPDTTAPTVANALTLFDSYMSAMDDAGVPEEGRLLYCTPAFEKLLKEAQGLERVINLTPESQAVNRKIHSLDDVQLIKVPSARFKTSYNFTTGFTPATGAKQINMILVHPDAVIGRMKYEYIRVFEPGNDPYTADNYIYQNRCYWDIFAVKTRLAGIQMNVEA